MAWLQIIQEPYVGKPPPFRKRQAQAAQRPALPAAGENQLAKRNQIPRLNQAENAEPTSRPVHALLGGTQNELFD